MLVLLSLLLLLPLPPLPFLLLFLLLLLHDGCVFLHLSSHQPQMLKVRYQPFTLGCWFT
ncbi:uncharacterized protein [Anolis sagrei]|uniref:uncharacterized protein n=1 Tax=Anolis sagrei TaxID=38937 RepID=UPI002F2B57A0